MTLTCWSDDAFLDKIRATADPAADACVAALPESVSYAQLFSAMKAGSDALPADAPQGLRDFFAATDDLPVVETDRRAFPAGLDYGRLANGRAVFLDNIAVTSLVLLAKALPEGYSAPCLSIILNLSGDLEHHPWRRLLGVLQLVVDIFSADAFAESGQAICSAQKVRLMHAGIRHYVERQWKGYDAFRAQFGEPINLEDRLATIMGFSLLVINGTRELDIPLSAQDAEDYYYVWRVFALMMAIHPPDDPASTAWVPATIAEAQEFYTAYARRHYATAAKNPDGCKLAADNLRMLEALMPSKLRWMGLSRVPRFYMTQLIGLDGCARVGLAPAGQWPITRLALMEIIRAWSAFWAVVDRFGDFRSMHERVSAILLQRMITRGLDRDMNFDVPFDLSEIRSLARPSKVGAGQA